MSTNVIGVIKRWDWRRILFALLAGLVTYFLLTNLFRLTAPWASMAWYPHDDPRQLTPELHRWHEAMWGAVTGILEGGVLLMLLWRPRQNPLLIQLMASVIIGAVVTVLPFEPSLLFVIVMVTLVVISYPNLRALLDFSREGPISRPLLSLSLAAAVLLVPYIVRLTLWQLQGFGVILAWLRLATGSIWPCIFAHAAWNSLINGGFTFATQKATENMWIGETGILVAVTLVIVALLLRRSWGPTQLMNES